MTVPDSYPRGVPISIKYPVMPVYEFWRNSARKFPDRDAVIYFDAKHTYSKLWDQMEYFAVNLMCMGIKKGDRIALLLPNCPQFLIAYNAVHLCGGTVVAINPLLPVDEIERQLKLTDSKILVILDRLLEKLSETYPKLIIAEAAYYTPRNLRALSRIRYRFEKIDGAYKFENLIMGTKVTEYPEIDPIGDTAVILFTSGTTGPPKGVMLTHYSQVTNALQSYHWLRGWGFSEKPQLLGWPVILCAMPFFHSYGLVVMNEAVSFGCTMVLIPQPTAEAIMKVTDKHKVTHFPLIPRLIHQIIEHPKINQYDLTSLTTCSSGGAHISVPLMQAFEKVSGARMYQGYGLSETGPIVAATPVEGDTNYQSTGLPYPDTVIKIMDLQLGEIEQTTGKEGEIIVKGPQIMKGYFADPVETAKVLKNGWLYTGDIGRIDENGYLYIVGRKNDRIVAFGHTVWPTIVEDVLSSHPSVKHAIAFGVPDPFRCSTDIRAMVVLNDNIKQSEAVERELLTYCAGKLEEYEVPTRIMFRDRLPLTLMGKVDRKKIVSEIDAKINEFMQVDGIPEDYR
jgi:long-chain acyl-CoA synthetase